MKIKRYVKIMVLMLSVLLCVHKSTNVSAAETDVCDEYITKTEKNEENSAQISVSYTMPEGFNLGIYCHVRNTDTSDCYEILATKVNEYREVMFVPEGNYEVIDITVDGDITGKYPMTIPENFEINAGDIHVLVSTLANYEEIENEANARLGKELRKEAENVILKPEEEKIYPWREFNHKGDGSGIVYLKGCCKHPVNLIVKITATGKIKEAEYIYSTDGGLTWSESLVVNNSFDDSNRIYTTDEGLDTGLTLSFDNKNPFLIYDEYQINLPYEYAVTDDTSNVGAGTVYITSDEVIYGEDYNIKIKITKSGKNGEGFYKYSLNDGMTYSQGILIPQNGVVILNDAPIKLFFYDGEGKFLVGDTFKSDIEGDMSNKNITPVVFMLMASLIIAMIAVYKYYSNMKYDSKNYTLNTYQRIQNE